MKKKKNTTRHYVHNPDLLAALIKYQDECKQAEAEGLDQPQIPDYIGKCILLIARRLSTAGNFCNYSYRDEMISDGVENAIKYGIKNFSVEKTTNPFGYFSQIMYWAFVRRIKKEQRELYVKHKVTQNSVIMGEAYEQSAFSDAGSADFIDLDNDYMNEFVKNYEKNLEAKRTKPAKKQGLEKFVNDGEDQS